VVSGVASTASCDVRCSPTASTTSSTGFEALENSKGADHDLLVSLRQDMTYVRMQLDRLAGAPPSKDH
jgi:hypothetical protein